MSGGAENHIGIDLGGTWLRVARVGADGHGGAIRRVPTERGGPSPVIGQMSALIAELRDENTAAIGVGIPGAFDGATGTVLGIPALPAWSDVALAAELRARTALPCLLENDAKVAALGEWRAGAGRGHDNFVYVTIGTGIGSAAIVDGRLLRGVRGLAGEIGHTKITDGGDRCACGLFGCWQAAASGTALDNRARDAIAENPGSALALVAGGAVARGTHVAEAARAGDAEASALLAAHAALIGVGLANLQHVYSPDVFVIGGGMSALLDVLRDGIEKTLRARLLPGFDPAGVVAAALGDDAGVIGAADLARNFVGQRDGP
jgi:glucokinase